MVAKFDKAGSKVIWKTMGAFCEIVETLLLRDSPFGPIDSGEPIAGTIKPENPTWPH